MPGPYRHFDTTNAPVEPEALFSEWLQMAIRAGIREPHSMTLSTVDAEGRPDARVLILKNIDDHGWHFAITRSSPKGHQIAHTSNVALAFYWPALGRQVRIRGSAHDMGPQVQAADFLARPCGSRAAALLGRQSDVLVSERELEEGLLEQLKRLEENPQLVSPHWAVYAVRPDTIEFWQGDELRRHTRLRYQRNGSAWTTERLWP